MLKKIVAALVISLLPYTVLAAANASKEEAQAMVDRAADLYAAEGLEALSSAVKDSGNANFHDRDLYVVVFERGGVPVAHGTNPALEGRDMLQLRDVEGHTFIQSMNDTAFGSGSGWIDYIWMNPQANVQQRKTTYVRRLGDNHFVAVGAYAE